MSNKVKYFPTAVEEITVSGSVLVVGNVVCAPAITCPDPQCGEDSVPVSLAIVYQWEPDSGWKELDFMVNALHKGAEVAIPKELFVDHVQAPQMLKDMAAVVSKLGVDLPLSAPGLGAPPEWLTAAVEHFKPRMKPAVNHVPFQWDASAAADQTIPDA